MVIHFVPGVLAAPDHGTDIGVGFLGGDIDYPAGHDDQSERDVVLAGGLSDSSDEHMLRPCST